VSEPVTVAETSLLARDQERRPWQQALVLTLAGGLTRTELAARLAERISYAPRFRRVVAGWPIAGWVDDANFNLAGHIGEVTLGRDELLEDWLELHLATALPRSHPLWAATLVQDPARGSQSVVVRVHPALVDGYANIHLFSEALDEEPEDSVGTAPEWTATQTNPPEVTDLLDGLADPVGAARTAVAGVLGIFENGLRSLATEPRPQHLAAAEVDLAHVARVKKAFGCSTHDVLLALATAGVRGWLAEHNRPLVDPTALVPLAIAEPNVLDSAIGCRISPSFDLLPVSCSDPAERLETIATLTRARRDSGVSVPARDLIDLAGFAPATLHAVAAGTVVAGRPHTVVVNNVPGPDGTRYLGRARVRQVYAVTATTDAEELSISITSYRGRVTLSVAAIEPADSWVASIGAELAALAGAAR
jgi:diacylglycerol O-acyltransferase